MRGHHGSRDRGQYVNEDTITVALPTLKNADGTICTSYVAEATRGEKGKIDTVVKQACDTANEHLVALQNFESGGLTIQTPTLRVTQ